MRDKAERNHFYVSFMWHMLAFYGVQVKGKGAYPGFPSMKRLGIFLLLPGWDASPSQGYPQN